MMESLLVRLLERLGASDKAEVLIALDDFRGASVVAPTEKLDALCKHGILKQARPANEIICDGCEENCLMPVIIRPAENGQDARAFISCDKRDDVGRVPVDLSALEQWSLSGAVLAKVIADLLGLEQEPERDGKNNRWLLGTIRGKKQRGVVAMTSEGEAALAVSGHKLPLAGLLTLTPDGLAIKREELLWSVDHPVKEGYTPSVVKRENRKLQTQALHETWQKECLRLTKLHPNLSDKQIAAKISKSELGKNRKPGTIRRNIKKQGI